MRARAWLVIGPMTLAALSAFVFVGFLAGPGVLLTLTLMIAGLLLGRTALLGLAAFSCATLVGLTWLLATGYPLPSPDRGTLSDPLASGRTIVIMFLAMSALGSLIIDLVKGLEGSLARTREEARLRVAAELARREAEVRVVEAQHLESLGRLAAGIAHDFNNKLATIVGCAELLGRQLAREGHHEEDLLDEILQASYRSAELTQQLLAYSRKAQMVRKALDLHTLIEDAVRMFRRAVDGDAIAVITRLEADAPMIAGDVNLLQGSLVNLLVNARDAMPNGGTLTVLTHDCASHKGNGEGLHTRRVRIEIIDTGEGISPETLPRIFDPFFTTKPVGKGTGLGLAAVAGTITAHEGTVEAKSELGRGSTFRIELPCIPREEVTSPPSAALGESGQGKLLIVEDDVMVRRTASLTLSALGYQVAEASDGPSALDLVRSGKEFDLVLLDLRMPGMNGEAVFTALQVLDSTLPVILWSGYAAEQDIEAMLRKGAMGFIQKPYRVDALGHLVASALRRSRERALSQS